MGVLRVMPGEEIDMKVGCFHARVTMLFALGAVLAVLCAVPALAQS